MPIRPDGLDGITAHHDQSDQLKSRWFQRPLRTSIDVPQNVCFTLAIGAWATAPQLLKLDETLAAVVPFDGQFIADSLNVQWTHLENLSPGPARVHTFPVG